MFNPISFSEIIFKKYLEIGNHPFKIRIQNLIGKYMFGKGIEVKDEKGTKFCLNANDWITRTILLDGGYEKISLRLSERLMEKGGVFIDAGANFGLYTCQVGRKDNCIVYSIEPNFKIIPSLVYHIKVNKIEHKVHILNVALSSKVEFATIDQVTENNLGSTATRPGKVGLISVLSCPLEKILYDYQLNEIQLLKIDIEGNEFSILENFPFNKFTIQNIILEFNELSPISLEQLISFFTSHNFKSYTVTGLPLSDDNNDIPENNIWFRYENGIE